MESRKLGSLTVSALGLGCMGMSHGYGTPDDTESRRVLARALELGVSFWDTADFYGNGVNEQLLSAVDLQGSDEVDIETGLRAALLACADLALDPEVVALQRMVLQESAAFPELAANFYSNGISRTVRTLAGWLCVQVQRKRIAIDDAEEVAGMLIGMVASAPQRAAIYGGMPLPSRKQIERRVQTCASLFLDGCRAA